jgi:hypothetical protein
VKFESALRLRKAAQTKAGVHFSTPAEFDNVRETGFREFTSP